MKNKGSNSNNRLVTLATALKQMLCFSKLCLYLKLKILKYFNREGTRLGGF